MVGNSPRVSSADRNGMVDRVVRAALASLPHVSVLLFDPELRYLAVLGAAPHAHGYSPEALLGRPMADVLPPAAYERIGAQVRRALRGETFTDTLHSVDGQGIYETTYGPAVEDGEVIGAVAVVRDVTVEQRALTELAAADELHQTILGNISDVITLAGVPDGGYSWVSPSVERVTGWRAADLVGLHIADYAHPDDLPAVREGRAELMAGAAQVEVRYRFRRSDGRWMWLEGHARAVRDAAGEPLSLVSTMRDVSDRVRLEGELAQALSMFELSFAAAPIGMALVSVDGRWLKVNSALCELLERDEATLLAGTFQDVTHPADLGADLDLLREVLDGTRTGYRLEKRYLRPDGTVVWVLLAVALVRDEAGAPAFFISQVEDISERKHAQHEMERLATTDPLTGLPNRLLLMDRLRHALAIAHRSGRLVGVVFVDLDRFKEVNDTSGHDSGDELLRQVATRLVAATREGDTTTRLGGDEFVVLCEQVGSLEEVRAVAERLRDELSRPFAVLGREVQISASVGVTVGGAETGSDAAEALLRDADRSMYSAKRRGRAQVDMYSAAFGSAAADRFALHSELRAGISRGELRVHHQPIVDLRTGAVVAREALVRWAHPTRGLLAPREFLDGTDHTPLGVQLGEEVMRIACADAASWPDRAVVHVNVSARHIAQAGFPTFVAACLDATGLPADRLVLEITESLVLAATRSTLASTAALTEIGVALCLDDFGTGYSSITALHRLPIDSLKIDRSFVAGILDNPASATLVEGLVNLGAHMGIGVVAEGVETADQARWLAETGCPHGQGFHFGRPGAVQSPATSHQPAAAAARPATTDPSA